MKTIMVQMSDEQWTMKAMHFAGAVARNSKSGIVLLRLVLANNPGLLGWGIVPPTSKEQHQMKEYASVAQDYGVEFCVQTMHFITLIDALAQAVELSNVGILFAHIPHSKIPLWRHYQLWRLKRQLGNIRFFTLDEEQPLSIEAPTLSPLVNMETITN